GSFLQVKEGDAIYPGQILVKKLRESSKSRDITGGLPRVSELFEARRPRNVAVVSEIAGKVKFGDIKSGSREVFVIPSQDIEQKKYLVPSSKHILVHENEEISAGEPISEGSTAPQEILSILGPRRAQEYMVLEIQEVYRSQGVRINDKHIEIIVRQMLQRAQIIDPGDSGYLEGDIVDFHRIDRVNRQMQSMQVVVDPGDSRFYLDQLVSNENLADEMNRLSVDEKNQTPKMRHAIPATSRRILMGITQAALTTESFISAASFQETTRVLTAAAINGREDTLVGLKENLIMGNRIPAGTGLAGFDNLIVENPDEDAEEQTANQSGSGAGQKSTADTVVEPV
ncbi:DNA-directed RNA polymerase subunit beta', partial [bacterium]|nr:DNA-directed RNA polymerase subunit beta' [bacterium]